MQSNQRVGQGRPGQHVEVNSRTNANRAYFGRNVAQVTAPVYDNSQYARTGGIPQHHYNQDARFQQPARQLHSHSTPGYPTPATAQTAAFATAAFNPHQRVEQGWPWQQEDVAANIFARAAFSPFANLQVWPQVIDPRVQIASLASRTLNDCQEAQVAVNRCSLQISKIISSAQATFTPQIATYSLLNSFQTDVKQADKYAHKVLSHCQNMATARIQGLDYGVTITSDPANTIAACQQVITALGNTMQQIVNANQTLSNNVLLAQRGFYVAPVSTSAIANCAQIVQSLCQNVLLALQVKEIEIKMYTL